MNIINSCFLVVILSFLHFPDSYLADTNISQEARNENINCNGYCFSVFKPVIEHFVQLKTAADTNDELKIKILFLESTNKNLMIQLSNAETQLKNHIRDKTEQIKNKDDRIMDKTEQIKNKDDLIKDKTEQIKNKDDQIREKTEQIKNKDDQIKDKTELIKNKDNQIKDTTEQMKNKDDQIKEKTEQIKNKDDQIIDLRNHINLISKTLAEKSEQLLKCKATKTNLPDTCPSGRPNGIYQLQLHGMKPFEVPCKSSESVWTVIQRRKNGSVDFSRKWKDYREGFGDVRGEFFIGLEKLHLMTKARPHELYIKLLNFNGTKGDAYYDDFEVGSDADFYQLKGLGKYSGSAGDSLIYHKNMPFVTFDNDPRNSGCPAEYGGGWWFRQCGFSSLNGRYYKNGKDGIFWELFTSQANPIVYLEMMIKPRSLT